MRWSCTLGFLVACFAAQACSAGAPSAPSLVVTDAGTSGNDTTDNSNSDDSDNTPTEQDGPPIDPVDCSVTFTKHIFPRIQNVWRCGASACHSNPGANAPVMDTDTAQLDATYTLFTTTTYEGKKLVDPTSMDPNASALTCLLAGTCGQRMPYQGVSASDIEVASTWLSCGAPK